jgi:uncharacterized protein (TIGR03545 family)
MRRLLHWKFVVPRVLLVVVVLLGAQYVVGLVVRSMAIRSGEAALGSQVNVGHVRVSFADRQVVFRDLRVANSQKPSDNLLEADRCELNFAGRPLLRKQAVVESGRIEGLRFGSLADSLPSDNAPASGQVTRVNDDADLAARKWLAQLNDQFTLEPVKQFDSVVRTEAFCTRWSKQSAALDARLQDLDARAAELQAAVDAAQANPLRNDRLLDSLQKKVAGLQNEFADIRTDIEKLPDLLETQRREIVAARRHDEEVVGSRSHLEPADANSLSAYLLRDDSAKRLNKLVGWLRWMREMVPVDAKTPLGRELGAERQAGGTRGESILFAGSRQEPGILIRSLQFNGAARVGGQPFEFRGVLTNLASVPKLHNQPIRLRMVGTEAMPLDFQATIDRTGQVPRDELLVDCQCVLLPDVTLGHTDQLEMQLAPSVGSLSVSVVVEGQKISGDIQMVEQKAQITPALHGSNSALLAAAMSESLGHVNSVATRLSLGGTLERPTCTIWSNLGTAVAEAMKRGLRRADEQHARALLVEAGRRVDERLADVDRQVAEQQARFANKSADITTRLLKIATGEAPRYRISDEQGGRRLPKNSLFR